MGGRRRGSGRRRREEEEEEEGGGSRGTRTRSSWGCGYLRFSTMMGLLFRF
jgi:hypothetical protein